MRALPSSRFVHLQPPILNRTLQAPYRRQCHTLNEDSFRHYKIFGQFYSVKFSVLPYYYLVLQFSVQQSAFAQLATQLGIEVTGPLRLYVCHVIKKG